MDFAPSGTLYAVMIEQFPDNSRDQTLITIDVATGEITTIGQLGGLSIGDIDFAPDGNIYTTNFSWALLRINPVDSEHTLLVGFGDLGALSGIASFQRPPCQFLDSDDGEDIDSDGLIDECDSCPASQLNETIVINNCDTNVVNILFDDGCTMNDMIAECQSGIQQRIIRKNDSCIVDLAYDWLRSQLITIPEFRQILVCIKSTENLNRNILYNLQP